MTDIFMILSLFKLKTVNVERYLKMYDKFFLLLYSLNSKRLLIIIYN